MSSPRSCWEGSGRCEGGEEILLSQIRCDMRWSPAALAGPTDPGVRCVKALPPQRLLMGKGAGAVCSGPGGEENQRWAHTDSGLWGWGEGSCVLGILGLHLTSQSGYYSEENSFRVEILLTSAPVAESVCHPSLSLHHMAACRECSVVATSACISNLHHSFKWEYKKKWTVSLVS